MCGRPGGLSAVVAWPGPASPGLRGPSYRRASSLHGAAWPGLRPAAAPIPGGNRVPPGIPVLLVHSFIMRTVVLPLALLPILTSAQSWCPPGATWNFVIQAWMTDGHVVRTYIGDTLVDGWVAQQIKEEGQQILYWSNDTITIDDVVLTSVQDSVLYTRVQWGGQPAWDTLYRFDAEIGDRWFPPGADSVCLNGTEGMVEVVDTATVLIDGLPLRQWTMSYIDATGQSVWGTFYITERLGSLYGFTLMPSVCIIVEYGEQLRCYSDDQIEYHAPGWGFSCTSATDVHELGTTNGLLFPNPGTTHFTLALPPGPHTIALLDATGRVVIQQRTTDPRPLVSTEALPAGLYRISIRDGSGRLTGTTWVKE